MTWHEVSIEVPFEYVEPISYLFDRHGNGLATELQDNGRVLLRTYLPSNARQQLAHIEVGVKLANILEPLGELKISPLDDEADWQNAWKSHFSLLKLGRRLVIKPSWIDYDGEPGEWIINLDPGMAFGTGYHPTTYTCLELLEELIFPGAGSLDLGTGSGILTIAMVKLGAAEVVALDTDPVAVRTAGKNFQGAQIEERVKLAQGTVPHPLTAAGGFDLAVANISARAVGERAGAIRELLKPEGVFIGSGIIHEQRHEAEAAIRNAGFTAIEIRQREDWIALVCRNR